MPSASPRSLRGNQDMTARPLAEFTLAPAAPARASSTTKAPNGGVVASGSVSRPHIPSPAASARRSPQRSAASPQGSSVAIGPIHGAAISTPTSVERQAELVAQRRREHGEAREQREQGRLRRGPRREDGPAVPRGCCGYRPNGLKGLRLVETRTLFVSR